MVSTTDIEAAWRQHSEVADDHMPPQVADLLVRLFHDHGLRSEIVALGGGLVGVEVRDLAGVEPEWTVVAGVVEHDGWWVYAEADTLADQPPVVMLGEHAPDDAVALIATVAPRLQRDLGVDHSLSLAELETISP